MHASPETPASGLRALRQRYPKTVAVLLTIVIAVAVADIALLSQYLRYRSEVRRLRAGMTDAERQHADLVLASEQHRIRVMVELARRQARGDRELHLAVAVDSGRMHLEREGVVLRSMDIRIGPEKLAGNAPDTLRLVAPRGARTVQRVLTSRDTWEVPRWVFEDRGLPVPNDRAIRGALGGTGVVLNGGTLIYSTPSQGPLADSAYVLPGAILVDARDLAAIAPNIVPGLSVYFY
jgi:hypothetical protein